METAPSLENLRPALAGLIVDNEVGRKEAYATFINLVERGYIEARKAKGGMVFYSSKKNRDGLHAYEARLLPSMEGFGERTMKKLLDGIYKEDIFTEDIFAFAINEKVLENRPELLKGARSFTPASKKYEWQMIALMAFGLFIIYLIPLAVLIAMFDFTGIFSAYYGNPGLFFLTCLVFAIATVALLVAAPLQGRLGKGCGIVTENAIGQRKKYLELLDYLKAHPLSDYRWGNEFLPYAIAFGLYENYDMFPK